VIQRNPPNLRKTKILHFLHSVIPLLELASFRFVPTGHSIGYSDLYFFSISMAVHPLVFGIGPLKVKKFFKNEIDPGISCRKFRHLSQ
jgi:hypothetical protein